MLINDNWEIVRDGSSWETRQTARGVNPKTGKAGKAIHKNWFATLDQACRYVLNNGCDDENCKVIIKTLRSLSNQLSNAIASQA